LGRFPGFGVVGQRRNNRPDGCAAFSASVVVVSAVPSEIVRTVLPQQPVLSTIVDTFFSAGTFVEHKNTP